MSTIFLNGFTYSRHRLGYGHVLVKVFFVLFALSFMCVRLVGTTYISIYWTMTVLQNTVAFRGIPRWHLYVLCAALISAVFLQIFWAVNIVKNLLKSFASGETKARKSS